MPNGNSDSRNISRRQWMQALGITGVTTLAGCSGDDDQGTETGTETGNESGEQTSGNGNSDSSQRVNYMRGGTFFPDLNWNQYSDNHNSTLKHFFDSIGAWIRRDTAELEGLGYTDWNYDTDSQVLSVTLRDDITFWNGDQYTADDLWTYHEMLRLQNPEGSPFESIEATGDYTVEFTTKDAQNPDILYRSWVNERWFEFGEQVWTEWLEKYQDASGQDARDQISQDLVDFEITSEELVEEGYGTGAYQIDDVTDEYIDVSAYEDHYTHAGKDDRFDPNIENIRVWYADETGRRDQFIVNEQVDFAGHNHAWEAYQSQLPDYWEQLIYEPTLNPRKMLINWRNREYLQDVNFRRAMAAALGYENAATNVGEFPVEVHSGMHQSFNLQYWGEEVPSQLIDYGVNSDPELAQQYLDRSDFELEGGSIYGPDGAERDPMRFVIGGSAWGDVAQVAAEMLDQFGFPVETNNVGRSAKLDIVLEDMGAWDLSTETHYAGTTQHPSEYFWPNTFWGWRIGPGNFGPEPGFGDQVTGWLEDGETHSPFNGKPMVFEIPEEVGSEDLSGDTKEINIYDLYQETNSPIDKDRNREIIRDLSWAWNYMLPDIDVTFAVNDLFGNTQKLDWAESSELFAANHTINWFEQGLVRLSE